jgi:hypothetical protein
MRLILRNSLFAAILLAALFGGVAAGRAEVALDAHLEHARAALMQARNDVKNVPASGGHAAVAIGAINTALEEVTAAEGWQRLHPR